MDLASVLAAAEKVAKKYTTKQDLVRWKAQKEDGTEVNKTNATICYSTAMSILPHLEIQCFPHGKGGTTLPALWYYHFFRLLKRTGLIPPEIQNTHQGGENRMVIPRNGWDRHTLYITLCYYRFCDLRPNEIMRTMSLYKRLAPHGTSFLQCLHYGAATTDLGMGHCFMNFGPYGGADRTDLANGKALAWFSRLSKEERLKIYPADDDTRYDQNRYTYTLLAKQAKKFKSLKVEELVEILNPEHAHLYEGTESDAS